MTENKKKIKTEKKKKKIKEATQEMNASLKSKNGHA